MDKEQECQSILKRIEGSIIDIRMLSSNRDNNTILIKTKQLVEDVQKIKNGNHCHFKNIQENLKDALLELILIGANNITSIINDDIDKDIFQEIYHIHNIPTILINDDLDLVKYYIKTEKQQYIRDSDRNMSVKFHETWKNINNILNKPWNFFFWKR